MSRSTKVKFETTTVHFVRPLLGFNDDTFELAQHDADYPWFTLSVANAEFPSFITVDLAAAFTDLASTFQTTSQQTSMHKTSTICSSSASSTSPTDSP